MRKIYSIIAMMLLAVCPKAMAEDEATLLWSVTGDVKHDYDSETIDGSPVSQVSTMARQPSCPLAYM